MPRPTGCAEGGVSSSHGVDSPRDAKFTASSGSFRGDRFVMRAGTQASEPGRKTLSLISEVIATCLTIFIGVFFLRKV